MRRLPEGAEEKQARKLYCEREEDVSTFVSGRPLNESRAGPIVDGTGSDFQLALGFENVATQAGHAVFNFDGGLIVAVDCSHVGRIFPANDTALSNLHCEIQSLIEKKLNGKRQGNAQIKDQAYIEQECNLICRIIKTCGD